MKIYDTSKGVLQSIAKCYWLGIHLFQHKMLSLENLKQNTKLFCVPGINLLAISTYNFVRTIDGSMDNLLSRKQKLRGSAGATVGGILLILTLTSSLYHLVFMSGQRFYAIKWPIKYRQHGHEKMNARLAFIWMLSVLSAVSPSNSMAFKVSTLLRVFVKPLYLNCVALT